MAIIDTLDPATRAQVLGVSSFGEHLDPSALMLNAMRQAGIPFSMSNPVSQYFMRMAPALATAYNLRQAQGGDLAEGSWGLGGNPAALADFFSQAIGGQGRNLIGQALQGLPGFVEQLRAAPVPAPGSLEFLANPYRATLAAQLSKPGDVIDMFTALQTPFMSAKNAQLAEQGRAMQTAQISSAAQARGQDLLDYIFGEMARPTPVEGLFPGAGSAAALPGPAPVPAPVGGAIEPIPLAPPGPTVGGWAGAMKNLPGPTIGPDEQGVLDELFSPEEMKQRKRLQLQQGATTVRGYAMPGFEELFPELFPLQRPQTGIGTAAPVPATGASRVFGNPSAGLAELAAPSGPRVFGTPTRDVLTPDVATAPPATPGASAPGRGSVGLGPRPEGPLVPNQFGDATLTAAEAAAACGPAAAVAFARATGRNPTLREAVDIARTSGWTEGGGMNGIANQAKLLNTMGIAHRMVPGAVDWNAVRADAQSGNPVTISTPAHYFVADGFNQETGQYHVGASGKVFRQGGDWLTPAQITALGRGVNGAIYVDAPQSPVRSVAASAGAGSGRESYETRARQAAAAAQIDPDIFVRQINQESGFNPESGRGRPQSGAQGIAQIVPQWHPGVDPFDPDAALTYAANLMARHMNTYGNMRDALIAYNGGQGAINRWRAGNPIAESQQYVRAILGGP